MNVDGQLTGKKMVAWAKPASSHFMPSSPALVLSLHFQTAVFLLLLSLCPHTALPCEVRLTNEKEIVADIYTRFASLFSRFRAPFRRSSASVR